MEPLSEVLECEAYTSLLVLASHNTSELCFRTKELVSDFFLPREHIVGDLFMLENTQSIIS